MFVPEVTVKGQCPVGYTPTTIDGSGAVVTYQTGLFFPERILGDPDGSGADFYEGSDTLDLDLLYTLDAGEQYSIHWKQRTGAGGDSRLSFYESLDGTNWTEHPLSASEFFTTTNESSFETELITASINTRYIRFFKKSGHPDYEVDAVTYTADVCLVNPSCSSGSVENLISGYAISVYDEYNDPSGAALLATNALGVPDGEGARIDDGLDWIVIQLDDIIPAGQEYTVIYKRRNGTNQPARLFFDESIDASGWNEHSHSGAPVTETSDNDYYVSHTVIAETNTYYLRFRHFGDASFGDYWVDAIVFNAYECLPTTSILPDPASVCVSRNLILDGNPSGGTGSYTHEWSGPASSSLSATNVQTPTFSNAVSGSYDLVYKVTDSDGYSATDNITVTVELDDPPIAVCNDTTIYLDAAGTATVDAAGIDDGSYDVCGEVSLSIDITSFDCDDIGPNIVTLTVTDDNSQTDNCTATVTVSDNTAPGIVTAAAALDATLECDNAAGLAAALALSPTATDNCTAAPTLNLVSDVTTADALCANAYVRVRTWNFDDGCGNVSANYVQTITVEDNTAPVIVTAAAALDATLECDNAAGLAAALALSPTATDNCTAAPTLNLVSDVTTEMRYVQMLMSGCVPGTLMMAVAMSVPTMYRRSP